jgi:positive regulator of sigma E activity
MESHRFILAMVFIIGFIALIFIALLGEILKLYTGVKDLAAIFGGWITAVLAFYFLQQTADRAQQQTKEVTIQAEEARETAKQSERKRVELISKSEPNLLEIAKVVEEQQTLIKDLISDLERIQGEKKAT